MYKNQWREKVSLESFLACCVCDRRNLRRSHKGLHILLSSVNLIKTKVGIICQLLFNLKQMCFNYNSFKGLRVSNQLFIFILLSFFLGEILQIILEYFYEKGVFNLDFSNYSLSEIIFEVIILAPLIETFFIQFIIIELSLRFFSNKKYIYFYSILTSALIFGILHQYNTAYIIATFILGLWFGTIYVFYKKNKNCNPFLALFTIHLVYNSINLIKEYYL